MKTIFNLFLFLVAFLIGLVLVLSSKIISFVIGILFMALIIGAGIYVFILTVKKFSEDDDTENVSKNYKFTDDPRFKERKEKQ